MCLVTGDLVIGDLSLGEAPPRPPGARAPASPLQRPTASVIDDAPARVPGGIGSGKPRRRSGVCRKTGRGIAGNRSASIGSGPGFNVLIQPGRRRLGRCPFSRQGRRRLVGGVSHREHGYPHRFRPGMGGSGRGFRIRSCDIPVAGARMGLGGDSQFHPLPCSSRCAARQECRASLCAGL